MNPPPTEEDPEQDEHVAKRDRFDFDYNGYGFADVRRACHRWLMRRDEEYRKGHEARYGMHSTP